MNTFLRIVRSVAAIFVGYFVMGMLITLVQETWLGGVSYHTSSLSVLAVAGFFTFLSAVAGGVVAGLIAGRRPLLHGLVMCLLVVAETTWLVRTGRADGPLWFDAMAAASLMVGMLLGALLSVWRPGRRGKQVKTPV